MGGMEAHVMQLAQGLVRRGYEVATICSPQPAIAPMRDALAGAGIPVHSLALRRRSATGAVDRFRSLVNTLRRYPGAIVHLHFTGFGGGDLVTLAARLAGSRAVVRSVHLPPVPPVTSRDRLSVRVRDRLLDKVIYVSEQTRREHLSLLGRDERRGTVVNNGVDVQRFSPDVPGDGVHAEFGIDQAAPIVGTVSRLGEERKGIRHFVEMASIVSRAHPTCQFLIVGEGSLRPALEQQTATLGIADRVVFAGERQDIPRLLGAMRVFVMPSLYEACQYNLMEAMAMGLPVVSTPAGVAPDAILPGDTGILVPAGDGDALATGVLEVLEDPHLAQRLGRRAREMAVARFSLDAMVDGIASVYREVA
jgi:glycosyltransferase involved in cell wall biosynthesis